MFLLYVLCRKASGGTIGARAFLDVVILQIEMQTTIHPPERPSHGVLLSRLPAKTPAVLSLVFAE